MSVISTAIFKDEAGVYHHPAIPGNFNTHSLTTKRFFPAHEILIKWIVAAWVKQSVFSVGTVVALEAVNPDSGLTTWLDYPLNDYNSAECCIEGNPGG
jgi:hypothetical protein